jgi:hypothetical protein
MSAPDIFRQACEKNGWACDGNSAKVDLGGGRAQTIFVDAFVHEGEQMARAYSVIGKSGELSETRTKAALSINFNLAHGALAIREEKLVMTDTFVLEDADIGEVEASLRFLGATADKYEKVLFGTDQH